MEFFLNKMDAQDINTFLTSNTQRYATACDVIIMGPRKRYIQEYFRFQNMATSPGEFALRKI